MVTRVRGLVLNLTKHSDSLFILNLYTRELGKLGLFVNKPQSKKKSIVRLSHLDLLNVLELDIEHQPTKTIHQLRALHSCLSLHDESNYHKDAVIFFLAEAISKSIKHDGEDENLYDFLETSVELLRKQKSNFENFHLVFLHKMAFLHGFGVESDVSESKYFDLLNGIFTNQVPAHNYFISGVEKDKLNQLLGTDFETKNQLQLGRNDRHRLIEIMMEIYKLHIPGFGNMKTLDVLKELFD
jgi:DNA repair protein RecO (recombination protein O)